MTGIDGRIKFVFNITILGRYIAFDNNCKMKWRQNIRLVKYWNEWRDMDIPLSSKYGRNHVLGYE